MSQGKTAKIILRYLPLTEFRHVQNSLCVQVLRSPILAALLHGTPAAGSAKLCGVVQLTRNGITELSQRAPPIFCWVAMTLGRSAHILVHFVFRFYSISVAELFQTTGRKGSLCTSSCY